MDAQLRQITNDDGELLRVVAEAVFDQPIDHERLAVYLANGGHLLIVAIQAGVVVAQISAVVHHHVDKPDDLFINELGVTPTHRRRGLARRLLFEMLKLAKARGCEEAWLATEHENIPARALYETIAREEDGVLTYVFDTDRT